MKRIVLTGLLCLGLFGCDNQQRFNHYASGVSLRTCGKSGGFGEECPYWCPDKIAGLLIDVENLSNRTIDEINFRILVREEGHSTVVDAHKYTLDHYIQVREIKSFCYKFFDTHHRFTNRPTFELQITELVLDGKTLFSDGSGSLND